MNLNLTPAVKQILIACVVLFIGTLLLQQKEISLINILGLHYPTNPLFKPWQLLTHMFMHGGITHILFNMFGLITFGSVLESVYGTKKFVKLYFFSGLGALLIHFLAEAFSIHSITGEWWINAERINQLIAANTITQAQFDSVVQNYKSLMVGASGCLYGLSAAFALLFPNTEMMIMFIPYPIKAKYLIPGFILLDLFLGVSKFDWDPVAHFAHIGGALFGFLLALYWRKFDKKNFY